MTYAEATQVWADDGSLGRGFIHAPPYSGLLATVKTWGPRRGYYFAHTSDGAAFVGDEKSPAAGQGPGEIIGGLWSRQALYDRLHELGYLVVATASGGTYSLVRGEMPPGQRVTVRGPGGSRVTTAL